MHQGHAEIHARAGQKATAVAMSAFYLKGVALKHVTLNQIFSGMMPYMLMQLLGAHRRTLWA
jgi:TRAP-type mannitol/chloroaromatic compound transport system permease large subunit